MRSIQFTQLGLPTQVLQLVEQPTPTPGPGQLRVRVQARPINPSDLLFVQGLYGIQPQLPSVAGFEGAGVVDAVGEGCTLPVGTLVALAALGTWQEYVLLPERAVIPLPPDTPLDMACQLYVNPFSAVAILQQTGLQPGDWLLQSAGGSSFGQLIIQLCRQQGIHCISTVRRPEMVQPLLDIGAEAVIDLSQEKLPKRVAQLTNGNMVKAAIDAVGGDTGADMLKCLAPGGTLHVYGLLSLQPIPLNSGLLIFRNISLRGFWLSEWVESAAPEVRRTVKQRVIELVGSGQLQMPVEARYDLAQVHAACAHAERPGRTGKILLAG